MNKLISRTTAHLALCMLPYANISADITASYNAHTFGIVSDPVKVQTSVIQNVLNRIASDSIGGILRFPEGSYVSGTLSIPSNVGIHLDKGASLLGSTDPFDYSGFANESPASKEQSCKQPAQLCGFIISNGTEGISLSGSGTIDGRGLEVALAIDSLHHTGIRPDPNYNTRRMRPSLRPKLFDFVNVRSLTIDSLNIRSSASWGISLNKCEDVCISDINFINRAYWNNDGIDIADCKRVRIERCFINSADDGIVLKSFDPDDENFDITITDCRIISSANAFKIGTESFGGFRKIRVKDLVINDTFRSAVAIESVDGADINDVLIEDVAAQNTGNAFFIRLGDRNGDAPGSLKDVTIRRLSCDIPFGRPDIDYDLRGPDINTIHNPFPNSITGIPEAHVENILLEDISVSHPGRGTKGMGYVAPFRIKNFPELRDNYPEFHMFGELPAWALFVRHVDGLTLRNVDFTLKEPDYRQMIVTDDVNGFIIE